MGRKKTLTDEELLEKARAMFVKDGIGASTKAIAKEAGISEATIFQRFPSKADLFFAAMTPPTLNIDALFNEHYDRNNVFKHLEELAFAMLAYFRSLMPILLPLAAHPSFDFEEFAARNPDSPLSSLRTRLREHMALLRKNQSIASDSDGATLILFTSAFSFAFLEKMGAHHGEIEPILVQKVVNTLWAGVAPEK